MTQHGSIVVVAGFATGSWVTARMVSPRGRAPPSVYSQFSEGNNALIRVDAAHTVA
jgi:predicted Rossmann fold nucleotide-binding protein DprA/Smf involved in DNA uptake